MNYFIFWMKPVSFMDYEYETYKFISVLNVFEGDLPLNYCDQRLPFTTAN